MAGNTASNWLHHKWIFGDWNYEHSVGQKARGSKHRSPRVDASAHGGRTPPRPARATAHAHDRAHYREALDERFHAHGQPEWRDGDHSRAAGGGCKNFRGKSQDAKDRGGPGSTAAANYQRWLPDPHRIL